MTTRVLVITSFPEAPRLGDGNADDQGASRPTVSSTNGIRVGVAQALRGEGTGSGRSLEQRRRVLVAGSQARRSLHRAGRSGDSRARPRLVARTTSPGPKGRGAHGRGGSADRR